MNGKVFIVSPSQLIDEQAQKGLILDEDSKTLNTLFEEQYQNLSSFRPFNLSCFSWLRVRWGGNQCNTRKKLDQIHASNGLDCEIKQENPNNPNSLNREDITSVNERTSSDTKSTGDILGHDCDLSAGNSTSTLAGVKDKCDQ